MNRTQNQWQDIVLNPSQDTKKPLRSWCQEASSLFTDLIPRIEWMKQLPTKNKIDSEIWHNAMCPVPDLKSAADTLNRMNCFFIWHPVSVEEHYFHKVTSFHVAPLWLYPSSSCSIKSGSLQLCGCAIFSLHFHALVYDLWQEHPLNFNENTWKHKLTTNWPEMPLKNPRVSEGAQKKTQKSVFEKETWGHLDFEKSCRCFKNLGRENMPVFIEHLNHPI